MAVAVARGQPGTAAAAALALAMAVVAAVVERAIAEVVLSAAAAALGQMAFA